MANPFISKLVYYGRTLFDLTGDTVASDKVLKDYTFHDKTGAPQSGTCTFDADTSDATATENSLVADSTAYARGVKLTGKIPNKGKVDIEVSNINDELPIDYGVHDGSGRVTISAAEKAKVIAANIRKGITLLGVPGEMEGTESVNAQSKTVVSSNVQQEVLPDTNQGYTHLASVIVQPIPYVESDNAAGGITVTIG